MSEWKVEEKTLVGSHFMKQFFQQMIYTMEILFYQEKSHISLWNFVERKQNGCFYAKP